MIQVTEELLAGKLLERRQDSAKRDYGHLLLVCGCRTMPGAAVLSCMAALESGCGLVTLHSAAGAAQAAVTACPSAMVSIDSADFFSEVPEGLGRYAAIGTGPGLGRAEATADALERLMASARAEGIPMLLDADALNIIAGRPELKSVIPEGSVMTPHLGELRRLVSWDSDGEKDGVLFDLCAGTGCVLVSKGYHTEIYTPSGEKFKNTTGNAGMAKGGSGDVLTGLVAGLMARGYCALDAALLGVWIHGYAGDCLTAERTAEAYSSRDLSGWLYRGFVRLREVAGPRGTSLI